jgi:two-component system, OmpR family, phosphate regulon response regulator PhoB
MTHCQRGCGQSATSNAAARPKRSNFRQLSNEEACSTDNVRAIVTAASPPARKVAGVTNSQKVLVVEDETDLLRTLEYNFRQAGFETFSATSGSEGLRLAVAKDPDLVLLDLMLPDVQGTEVCRQLKSDPKTRATPVIILTARGEEVDRVVGFEIGADDYVTKPFSVRELILRARAVLRRGDHSESLETVKLGNLTIDSQAHRVHVDGHEISLTALEFRLLWTLVRRHDRVQTRQMLLNDVWGLHLNVETRTIDTHIKRLREKLGTAGSLIETVRGVGYRLGPTDEPPE